MITATVVKAYDLFCFASDEDIATYGDLQNLVHDIHDGKHHHWWCPPCFTVKRDSLPYWAPEVKLMVGKYMDVHNIEVLVIVTDESAYSYLY